MSEIPATNDLIAIDDAAARRAGEWNRFRKVTVIFVAGWVSIILEDMVELDGVVRGFQEGFVGGAFVSPFLLLITVPLGWLGSRIGSWEKWLRYRTWFTFGLPVLFLLLGPAGALYEQAFPQARFQRFSGVEFPRDARVERCVIDDGFGLFYDPAYTYELTCSTGEIDRLIRELKLTRQAGDLESDHREGWSVVERWLGHGVSTANYIALEVDATRTKLRLSCWNI